MADWRGRKCVSAVLVVWLLAVSLSACSPGGAGNPPGDAPMKIMATVFPEYDWVKEILGGQEADVSLDMLVDGGVDLHSYQPSVRDLLDIADCDLFIYVGGESDSWVEETLERTKSPGRKVICLMDVLGDRAKEEEIIEGMESGEEEEETAYDEHVWLSLKNARICCEAIAEELAGLDPDHGSLYQENARAYVKKLSDLDRQYQEAADQAAQKTLLFGDRFPFRYLVEDYGLSYYAAFAGCSAESEVSFGTVAFLAGKADELGLSAILTVKGGSQKIAQTVRQNTRSKDQEILVLDSLQSVTWEDIGNGETYLSAMGQNLDVLKKVLE